MYFHKAHRNQIPSHTNILLRFLTPLSIEYIILSSLVVLCVFLYGPIFPEIKIRFTNSDMDGKYISFW